MVNKVADLHDFNYSAKVNHPQMAVLCYTRNLISCSCDLDLDPMTLIYKLDLVILKK